MKPERVPSMLPKLAEGIKERADRAVDCAASGRYDMAADCLGDAAAIARSIPDAVLKECDWTGEELDPDCSNGARRN